MEKLQTLVETQHAFFQTGVTRTAQFRLSALRRLRRAVTENEGKIEAALQADFGKPPYETLMCETALLLEEIDWHLRHVRSWMRPRFVLPSKAQLPGVGRILPQPRGVALIMSPWNYPVQLCLMPLVGALSAGCCAVVKPSAYAPASGRVIAALLGEAFPAHHVAVVEGGRAENAALLSLPFDHIFFTGSPSVGRVVMQAAAETKATVTLELGGKSPVVNDATADLDRAPQRVMFGKVLNAGQTCVAPDYVLIEETHRDAFVEACRRALERFFPGGRYDELPSIVSEKHYRRKKTLLEGQHAVLGGGWDDTRRFIEPTILVDVDPASPVMQEEIFAPILPVLTWRRQEEAVAFIRARPKPLALYLFTNSPRMKRLMLSSCSFGGGCVNDTILHLANPRMPFGGVGNSGLGAYHGKASFDAFTHEASVLESGAYLPGLRCHPYTEKHARLVRRLYGFGRKSRPKS